MPRKDKTPWLGYSGQSAAEILACKTTHRIDSLLCALEEAIDLRQSRTPGHAPTEEERTLLAVMALEREVNNGGFDQFFVNSSRQYAPIIVSALETIGCTEVAALARQAVLRALRHRGEAVCIRRVASGGVRDREDVRAAASAEAGQHQPHQAGRSTDGLAGAGTDV
jgi:hypothetical protein